MRTGFEREALAVSVLLAMIATPAPFPSSQQGSQAALAGVVTAAHTGEPLLGVQVIIKGTRRWTVTNAHGVFELDALAPGHHAVEVRHPERAPLTFGVDLQTNRTLEVAVRLETRTIALPEVVVEGWSSAAMRVHDFYARANAGAGGYFVTRKDIEQRQPQVLSEMLHGVPGLKIDCGFGICSITTFAEARHIMGGCPIQYFLDGVPFVGDLDQMAPDQVEGIEIYRGPANLPPEYNSGRAMCGVIAMWSRVPG